MSLDPLETVNRYTYVGGNVVNATDPSGLIGTSITLIDEGGGVKSKPTAPKPPEIRPVTPWAANANPNPPPVTPWRQNANPNPTPYTPPPTTTHGGNAGTSTQSSGRDEYLPTDQQASSTSQYVNGEVRTIITGNTSTVLGAGGCPPGWRAIVRGRTTVCEPMNGIGGGQLLPQDAWADHYISQTNFGLLRLLMNAAALPMLAANEDPTLVLQAIRHYVSNPLYGALATVLRTPGGGAAGWLGLALAVGIMGGIGLLLLANSVQRGNIGTSTDGYSASSEDFTFSSSILQYNYRLSGFNTRVGTLAEHLAKLLGQEVAGYPPSDPNPDDRATRGWCNTIKRFLEEFDDADYSERILNRDLAAAGIDSNTWDSIKSALRSAAEVCDDHWGDFGGGSLVTG